MSHSKELDTVIRELSGPVHRYIARQIGDRAVAEDLRQEALERIARNFPRFEGRSSVSTWAISIARNLVVDHLRRAAREPVFEELEDNAPGDERQDDALQQLLDIEMSACLRAEMEALSEPHRDALVLHDIKGYSAAETAAQSACTVAAAKIRIHRARAQLRAALEERCVVYQAEDGSVRCDKVCQ